MKKVFVLYSLRQKLTPMIYKTKSIVTKHINTNKALMYQQFECEQQAKTFIQKFSIQCMTNSINKKDINHKQIMSQAQVKMLVQSIVGKEKLQQKGKGKSGRKAMSGVKDKVVLQKQQQHQSQHDAATRQAQWTILPNGHAFRKTNNSIDNSPSTTTTTPTTQQIVDSSYSTLTHNHQSQSIIRQQMQQSTTEQQTTQGLTQQSSFSNLKDKTGKHPYWMVWNINSSQMIKMGKRKTQLGLLMYDLQIKHSKDWVKQNIQLKRFKNTAQAQLQLDELNKQKEFKLNKMKADKIRQNISTFSLIEEEQLQQQVKQKKGQQQEEYIVLNYDDIEDLTERVVVESDHKEGGGVNGKGKQRKRVKIESEKILWADDLIKQSIEVEEETVVDNINAIAASGMSMGSLGMSEMGPFIQQHYQLPPPAHTNPQPPIATSEINPPQILSSTTNSQPYNQLAKQQQIQQLNQSKEQLQTIVNFYQQMQQMQVQRLNNIVQEQGMLAVNVVVGQVQHQEQKLQRQVIIGEGMVETTSQTLLASVQAKPPVVKAAISRHPYNKRYIKQVILNKLIKQQQQQQHLQPKCQSQQHEYIIYPSLAIKQSPGFAIGSYQIKQSKTNRLIKRQSLPLGQCKHQQANLLSLAFTLSSAYNLHNSNKRMKLQLNQQMQQSLSYKFRFDKQMMETQQFMREIESKCLGRVQYIL